MYQLKFSSVVRKKVSFSHIEALVSPFFVVFLNLLYYKDVSYCFNFCIFDYDGVELFPDIYWSFILAEGFLVCTSLFSLNKCFFIASTSIFFIIYVADHFICLFAIGRIVYGLLPIFLNFCFLLSWWSYKKYYILKHFYRFDYHC